MAVRRVFDSLRAGIFSVMGKRDFSISGGVVHAGFTNPGIFKNPRIVRRPKRRVSILYIYRRDSHRARAGFIPDAGHAVRNP